MIKTYWGLDQNWDIFSIFLMQVGQLVGEFIRYMINRNETSFTLNDLHIVGFSLGAQVAGKAGGILNGGLARITGLDPAG